jgi:hypothetical protein
MLVEGVTGLVAVRRRMVALRCGDAMRKPRFGGVGFGLAAGGALSGEPQIDDLSHARALGVWTPAFRANYADTVAGLLSASEWHQDAVVQMIWATHG